MNECPRCHNTGSIWVETYVYDDLTGMTDFYDDEEPCRGVNDQGCPVVKAMRVKAQEERERQYA